MGPTHFSLTEVWKLSLLCILKWVPYFYSKEIKDFMGLDFPFLLGTRRARSFPRSKPAQLRRWKIEEFELWHIRKKSSLPWKIYRESNSCKNWIKNQLLDNMLRTLWKKESYFKWWKIFVCYTINFTCPHILHLTCFFVIVHWKGNNRNSLQILFSWFQTKSLEHSARQPKLRSPAGSYKPLESVPRSSHK